MENSCLLNQWLRIGVFTAGEKGEDGVLHCSNEEGLSWYEMVRALKTGGVYVLVHEGLVVCKSSDPSLIFPGGFELFWSDTQMADVGAYLFLRT